jgi:hypothetical protein
MLALAIFLFNLKFVVFPINTETDFCLNSGLAVDAFASNPGN